MTLPPPPPRPRPPAPGGCDSGEHGLMLTAENLCPDPAILRRRPCDGDEPDRRHRRDEQRRRRAGGREPARARPSARLRAVEHGADPRREIVTAGHGQHGRMRRGREPFREHDQLVGVHRRLRASEHRVVTGALRFEREAALRDPDERMEPVERTGHARDAVTGPVAAPHVFELVHDGPAQVRFLPPPCVGGHDDDRADDAAGHGPW